MATTKGRGKSNKKKAPKPKKLPVETPTRACDVCGMAVQEIHCRLVCPKCGATSDCSDP